MKKIKKKEGKKMNFNEIKIVLAGITISRCLNIYDSNLLYSMEHFILANVEIL